MTASAPIAGTPRTLPDAASAPPQDSGVPAHANFRSVLEHYHEPREADSKADDHKNLRDQKQQKDSDPATTLAAPQIATLPAEAPRMILPFAALTLRQDVNAPPDDTATTQDSTTQDPTTAADPKGMASPAPAIFPSTVDLRSFHLEIDTKPHTKSQVKLADPAPSRTVSTPADLSAPLLPVTTATTVDQAAMAPKSSSTLDETSDTAPIATSTIDLRAFIHTDSRKAAYQYHSSSETDRAPIGASRGYQQQPKVSDPTATITVPIPVTVAPVIQTVDPQRPLDPPAASNTPKQDAPSVQSGSVTQDSSGASASDSQATMSPTIEQASDTTPALPTGTLAFAAKLTPTDETPAPTSTPAPDASRPADSQSRVQAATPATARQFASEADVPADTHSGEGGSQSDKENRFAKPETLLPQTHAASQDQPTVTSPSHASPSPLTTAARMDQMQEPPATAPSGNHDITIRIPDSTTDQGTAVRFVERAGEVHVSVRTGDAEMAQTLRGGLNDLVNRLEDGGIRTQVWQPGADASTSQNGSHHPFADPDGSNGRQFSSGSNSEQESKQHNRPRWVEELEGSIGNPNLKETTQLWQA